MGLVEDLQQYRSDSRALTATQAAWQQRAERPNQSPIGQGGLCSGSLQEAYRNRGQEAPAITVSQNPDGFIKREVAKLNKESTMFGYFKDYTNRHKDAICTIAFVFVIDYFFLGGALRHKLRAIAEDMLSKAQCHLSATPAIEVKPNENKS